MYRNNFIWAWENKDYKPELELTEQISTFSIEIRESSQTNQNKNLKIKIKRMSGHQSDPNAGINATRKQVNKP